MSKRSAVRKTGVAPLLLAAALGSGTALQAAAEEVTPVAKDPSLQVLAAIERMSEADLKEFYLMCSREAQRGRLSSGEIAFCSVGYERLLKWTFRGNFIALLEWRRGLSVPKAMPSPF